MLTGKVPDIVAFTAFLSTDFILLFITGGMRRAQRRARASETEAAEQRERLLVTLRSIGDAVIATDIVGRVEFINGVAAELCGWDAAEAQGMPVDQVFDIVNEESGEKVENPVVKVLREKRVVGLGNHTVLRRRNGPLLAIADSGAPIRNTSGEITGVVLVFRDVTGERKAEAALRESEQKHRQLSVELESRVMERTRELTETLGELDAFSYTVAHDLRAPLRAISGFAELLLEPGQISTPEGRTYAERIKRSAARLDQLTRDVLNYSRIAQQKVELTPVNLDQLVLDLVEDYAQLSDRRPHIEIRSPLLPVLGHESLLMQAISNLLVNACKFMAEGAKPSVVIRSEAVDAKVRIWVEDNGIGIAPEDQKRLFTVFGRLNSTQKFEGTGIGLAIVKKAAERMGGTAGVKSEFGKGSQFWLLLAAAGPDSAGGQTHK